MKKLIIGFICLVYIASCCVQQMSAEDVLRKVDERSKSIEDLSGICKITMQYLGINASMKFEFAIKKPDKFRICNKGFMNFTMIGNGSNVLVILGNYALPLNASTNKEQAYKEKELMNPVEYIKKSYGNCTPKLVGSKGDYYIIEFARKNETARVWIDRNIWYPVKIVETKITPFGNATMIVEFENLKINSGLSDELFRVPRNVEVMSGFQPVKHPPEVKPKKYAVTVKILKTNDVYGRYLGIAINKHLPDRWWKTENYTCKYIVSSYDIGKTFKCYTDEPIKYVEVDVTSFLNYTWTVEVTLPNGKSKVCTVNAHTKCVVMS